MATATELARARNLQQARSQSSEDTRTQQRMEAAQSEAERKHMLEFMRAKQATRKKLEAMAEKIKKPSFWVCLPPILLGILGDIIDIIAVVFEVGLAPTGVGPLIPAGVTAAVDTAMAPVLGGYIWYLNHKSKEYGDFQELMQSGQKLQAQQEQVQKAIEQHREAVKTRAAKGEMGRSSAANKPAATSPSKPQSAKMGGKQIALTALTNPKQALKMLVAWLLDYIPYIEALPFRTYRTIRAYYDLSKAFKTVIKNWEAYQQDIG